MKKHFQTPFVLFALLVVIAITSCSKPDADANPNFSLTELLTSSAWKITFCSEAGNDRSSNFEGYTFSFLTSGKMIASTASENSMGSWNNENSASILNITINGNSPMPYLNKIWSVTSTENSTIILQNDNSGLITEIHFVKR